MQIRPYLRPFLIVLAYAAAYAVLTAVPGTAVWRPAAGLDLAWPVLFGLAYLPLVPLATLAEGLYHGMPAAALALSTAAVAGVYGAAAWWLRWSLNRGPHQPVRFVEQVSLVVLAASAVLGAADAAVAGLAGLPDAADAAFGPLMAAAWMRRAAGMLAVAPLALLALGPHRFAGLAEIQRGLVLWPSGTEWRGFVLELGAVGLALAAAATGEARLYVGLLPVLWTAWRYGAARAALAVVLTALGLGFVLPGLGAAEGSIFLVVLALTGLWLGALAGQRRQAVAALTAAYEGLDARLSTRTAALAEARQNLEGHLRERARIESSLQRSVDQLRERSDALATVNEKLRTSEEQLRELNARKDRFFSIISHDVKSMLVSAIGFSKLLISDAETLPRDLVKEFASHVHSSTTNTYDLLENLLTWARMQTGRMHYQREWHGVHELLQNNVAMLQTNAARKGIALARADDASEDVQVYADRNMINSVLQNLITNAIKFTERGGRVEVSARTRGEQVEIAVADTGVGIPPDIASSLFRIDTHHSSHGTEDEEGTGLGLVLCREMVEKHEGRIWVESRPGEGSTFRFTLPCAHAAHRAPAQMVAS
ncbi:MAG: HAMP domain-containing sensor histidine kinase [Rhodothermales bacterium]|nr:HAMP domain-containing sensor histidine kinase [Rhodothermales bacterium]